MKIGKLYKLINQEKIVLYKDSNIENSLNILNPSKIKISGIIHAEVDIAMIIHIIHDSFNNIDEVKILSSSGIIGWCYFNEKSWQSI